jgi:hypothetical protein
MPFPQLPRGDIFGSAPIELCQRLNERGYAEKYSLRANFETLGLQMRRREFIAGISAAACPLAHGPSKGNGFAASAC